MALQIRPSPHSQGPSQGTNRTTILGSTSSHTNQSKNIKPANQHKHLCLITQHKLHMRTLPYHTWTGTTSLQAASATPHHHPRPSSSCQYSQKAPYQLMMQSPTIPCRIRSQRARYFKAWGSTMLLKPPNFSHRLPTSTTTAHWSCRSFLGLLVENTSLNRQGRV